MVKDLDFYPQCGVMGGFLSREALANLCMQTSSQDYDRLAAIVSNGAFRYNIEFQKNMVRGFSVKCLLF